MTVGDLIRERRTSERATPYLKSLQDEHKQRLARLFPFKHVQYAPPAAPEPKPAGNEPWFHIVSDEPIPALKFRSQIHDIQIATCRHFGVDFKDLISGRRSKDIVRPRQVAMYLAKTLTLRSLPEIGRRFGGRDHTTVLHAVRKIEAIKDIDAVIGGAVEKLTATLKPCLAV